MKKNFFKFLLLGAFTLSLGAGFVGCKDYDDDIDDLRDKIEKVAKDLADLESSVGNYVKSVTFDPATGKLSVTDSKDVVNTLDLGAKFVYDVKIEDGELLVNGTSVGEVGGGGEEPQAWEYDFEIVDGKLEITLNGDERTWSLDLPVTEVGEAGLVFAYDVNDKVAKVTAVDGKGNSIDLYVAGSAVDASGMITSVKLVGDAGSFGLLNYNGLLFPVAEVLSETFTFGEGLPGAVTFTKGDVKNNALENYVVVQVTPSNAVLTASQVALFDGINGDINDYLNISVERYDGRITRAVPSNSDLWKVSFTLKDGVDMEAMQEVIFDENVNKSLLGFGSVGFSLAVENRLGTAERFVMSEYNIHVVAGDMVNVSSYDLDYVEVGQYFAQWDYFDYEDIEDIINKSEIVEDERWSNLNWDNVLDVPTETLEDDRTGNRNDFYYAAVGTDLSITNLPFGAVAYYVTFDEARATTAQKNAWASYGITGLNKVIEGSNQIKIGNIIRRIVGGIIPGVATPADSIKISLPASIGVDKEIGFVLYAVNANGYVIDPDGAPFWVKTVAAPTPPIDPTGQIDFTLQVSGYVAQYTGYETLAADLDMSAQGLNAAELALIDYADIYWPNGVSLSGSQQALFFDEDDAPVLALTAATTKTIRTVKIDGLYPSDFTTGQKFPTAAQGEALLIFFDADDNQLFAKAITITKPDAIFPEAFKFKSAAYGDWLTGTNLNLYFDVSEGRTFTISDYFDGVDARTTFTSEDPAKLTIAGVTGTIAAAEIGNPLGFKVSYDFGYFNSQSAPTYTKEWASPTVTTITGKSMVQYADAPVWSGDNPAAGYPAGTIAAGKTRTKFLFQTINPAAVTVTLDGLKAVNKFNNSNFGFGYSGSAWVDTNFANIEFKLAETATLPSGDYTDPAVWATVQDSQWFTLSTPATATPTTLTVTPASPETPPVAVPLTMIMRVTDQFGKVTIWQSKAGDFSGVSSL